MMQKEQQIIATPSDALFTPNDVSILTLAEIDKNRKDPGNGVRVGISGIDTILNPLRPSREVFILGRPSHGKTSFCTQWARNLATTLQQTGKDGEVVVFITWEMPVEDFGMYDLASECKMDSAALDQGKVTPDEWTALEAAAMRRATLPLWLIGHSVARRKKMPRLTMTNVAQSLMWAEREMGIKPKAIFLDYLQLIQPEESKERRLQVEENVYRIKDMAQALGTVAIAAAQARREVDDREWKVPMMGDGQESSAIEQAADVVIGVSRPILYTEAGKVVSGCDLVCEESLLLVGIEKQRKGRVGWRPMYFRPEINLIGDWEDAARYREHE